MVRGVVWWVDNNDKGIDWVLTSVLFCTKSCGLKNGITRPSRSFYTVSQKPDPWHMFK